MSTTVAAACMAGLWDCTLPFKDGKDVVVFASIIAIVIIGVIISGHMGETDRDKDDRDKSD